MEDQEKSLKSGKDLIYLKTRMEACLEHISPKSLQFSSVQSLSRVQLCDPMDYSFGSYVHRILQVRIL